MNELLDRCAGLDVHKKTIVACIMIGFGKKVKKEIRTFGTTTPELELLAKWLQENNISDAAIESTGIYWVPVYNILDEEFKIKLTLANARHIKNVPGRKTDVKDSEWLCKLLKCGLLTASFIPPKDIRDLRKLLTYKDSLIKNRTQVKNRIIKVLESANIKLASVLSNVFGVSGLKVVRLIAGGESNPNVLANVVDSQVRAPRENIKKALTGRITEVDVQILVLLLSDFDYVEKQVKKVECEISNRTKKYDVQMELLKGIPGVSDNVAAVIIASAGIDMDQFPTDKHFASWGGLVPGNNESAGKKKSTRTREGFRMLKKTLVEAAWAVTHVKKTFFSAFYSRVKIKQGAKKATVAIAHKIAVCAYWILKKMKPYNELGADYVDRNAMERKKNYYIKKLAELGCNVCFN